MDEHRCRRTGYARKLRLRSSAAEHKLIAGTVNRYHPDKATYAEIANSDHWGLYTATEKISSEHTATEVNQLVVTTAVKWMLQEVSSVN
jgi:hypothetical protein